LDQHINIIELRRGETPHFKDATRSAAYLEFYFRGRQVDEAWRAGRSL